MKIVGIIPARYGSTRFAGKPLADILGKTMIQRVVEQCNKATLLHSVIVATDDKRIVEEVNRFGGNAVLTSDIHTNGTERCAEVISKIDTIFDYVVNIQGDEPLISPEQIDTLCELIISTKPQLATLVRELDQVSEINSPNVVKCVRSNSGKALYFSRSTLPFARNQNSDLQYFQHIGIYAYAASTLKEIVQLKPSSLEQTESLEQLRWLENDYTIQTAISNYPSFAVDVPEDIEKIINQLKNEQ